MSSLRGRRPLARRVYPLLGSLLLGLASAAVAAEVELTVSPMMTKGRGRR